VWFAHAVPYTYTDLQRSLKSIRTVDNEQILKFEILCISLGGMPVPLLTITENI
jgi:hypothetical protein